MISAEGLQRLLNLSEPPSDELIDALSSIQHDFFLGRAKAFFGGFAKGKTV